MGILGVLTLAHIRFGAFGLYRSSLGIMEKNVETIICRF